MIRRRQLGGVVLAVGAGWVVIGLGAIAGDLWPEGEITGASFLVAVVLFVLPGLAAMAVGARIGRRRGGR
jgi:hypothetical protein